MAKPTNVESGRLRVVATARTEEAINEGARRGLFPLVKKVKPSKKIRSQFAVIQNKTTGEIEVMGDQRYDPSDWEERGIEMVIDFTDYYPHSFPSPFAAYLLPKDLAVGERVVLSDLIEDVVAGRWSQGSVWRLESCEAIWNGKDFEIQYKEPTHALIG